MNKNRDLIIILIIFFAILGGSMWNAMNTPCNLVLSDFNIAPYGAKPLNITVTLRLSNRWLEKHLRSKKGELYDILCTYFNDPQYCSMPHETTGFGAVFKSNTKGFGGFGFVGMSPDDITWYSVYNLDGWKEEYLFVMQDNLADHLNSLLMGTKGSVLSTEIWVREQ